MRPNAVVDELVTRIEYLEAQVDVANSQVERALMGWEESMRRVHFLLGKSVICWLGGFAAGIAITLMFVNS